MRCRWVYQTFAPVTFCQNTPQNPTTAKPACEAAALFLFDRCDEEQTMTQREDLLRRLADMEHETIDLCRSLVQIPSEDPPGDIRPLARYLHDYLGDKGIRMELQAIDERRPNLVGRVTFARPGPNIVFNGHMETLPVGDRSRWSTDPFEATLADRKMYGRGAKCMKGGVAALATAAVALREHRDHLPGSVTLAFVSDEVNGGARGTAYVLDRCPEVRGDVALVGEGGWGINFGHKGVAFLEIETTGEAKHGALSSRRASATSRMLPILLDLEDLSGRRCLVPPDIAARIEEARAFTETEHGNGATDALLRVSVNIGTLHGGVKVNVVAERCVAHVDIRVPPGMPIEEVVNGAQEIVRRHGGASLRILWSNGPTESSVDHPWFRTLQCVSGEVTGSELPFTYSHGFTDARFFRMRGIPAAGIGLRGYNVGGPNECIEVDNLLTRSKLFALASYDYLLNDTNQGGS